MRKCLALLSVATMLATPQIARADFGDNHRIEIAPYGGYSWTVSRRVFYAPDDLNGDLDIKSSGVWGVSIDLNAQSYGEKKTAITLLYHRQDSDLEFKPVGINGGVKRNLGGMAVEYWHVGGVGGIKQGNVLPFTSLSLGGTRYVWDIGENGGSADAWKFSMMLGLGAKVYVSERIGIKLQGRMPFTFFSSGVGLGFGTGGAYATVGGSGVAQFDVSAGLLILL